MFCTNCGKENKDGAKYCKNCGSPIITEDSVKHSVVMSEVHVGKRITLKPHINKKTILFMLLVGFVIVAIVCITKALQTKKVERDKVNIAETATEPTAPLDIFCVEEEFFGNEIMNPYIVKNSYDREGNLLYSVTYDTNGKITEEKKYLYEGGKLVRTDTYDEEDIHWETDYEYDEKGRICKEIRHEHSDGLLIAVPQYVALFTYDDKGILVEKHISGETSATWKYYPDERVEQYYEESEYEQLLKYYKKYDEQGKLIRYIEYDNSGNVLIAEEYVNKITYDQYHREVLCETYAGDTLRFVKKTEYYSNPNDENDSQEETMASETVSQEIFKAQKKEDDTIIFGKYEQDNNLENGSEDIEWLILEADAGNYVIISKYLLDAYYYHENMQEVSWETCSAKEWLNNDFYNKAFSAEEKEKIQNVIIDNSACNVYLLSAEEAATYFTSDSARTAELTVYAKANGAATYTYNNGNNGSWWTRTPSGEISRTAVVCSDGSIDTSTGGKNADSGFCIRPVLQIQGINE